MFTLPAYLYRGGTSKCWLFATADVAPYAPDREALSRLLSAALGGDDPREIDGVGGGTTTTSKAAVITATPGEDYHLAYTFAQVGIGDGTVEYGSNCGNCATGVGLFALDQGYAPIEDGHTEVRMFNTNTNTVLTARIATPGGVVPTGGEARVPGTRATGVPVELGFLRPGGRSTGALLPTDRAVDEFAIGDDVARASLVDAGAPTALLRATDLGLTGTESLSRMAEQAARLTAFRRPAALAMGLASPTDPISNAVPKVGIVGTPADYVTPLGEPVRAADYDVAARMLSMDAPHPAIGLTSAVAVAAAASVPGSVVADLLGGPITPDHNRIVRVGTPGGVVAVEMTFDPDGQVGHVRLHRAARRIAEARLAIPLPQPVPATV